MSTRIALKWIRIVAIVSWASLPSMAYSQATAFSWPVPSPRELMTSWGQYQHRSGGYYLHDGIDIIKDSTTYVIAVEKGWISRRDSSGDGDSLDWYLAVGTSQFSDNAGWLYTHLKGDVAFRKRWNINSLVNKGDTLGRVRYRSDNPSETHLHFERAWGFLQPSGIETAEWKYYYPYKNPLLILDTTGLAQRHSPQFWGRSVFRDSTERGLGSLKFKLEGNDTIWIVNRKIDVEDKCWYQIGNNYAIGAYKITYSIGGTGTQGPKGFTFSDRLQNAVSSPPNDSAPAVARTVYDTTRSTLTVGFYVISNTDSMNNHFEYGNLNHLQGYWNTAQNRDSTWNSQHNADSNAVAKFPDGLYSIRIRGEDEIGNYTLDSLKVIVNNFPPQVKSTYPESASAGVPTNAVIQVVFDQPMDTLATKKAMKLKLVGATDTVAGTKSWSGSEDTIRFTPTSNWATDTTYRVTFIAATGPDTTRDIADSTMRSDYSFPFSTRKTVLLLSFCRDSVKTYLVRYDTTATYQAKYDSLAGSTPAYFENVCYDRAGQNYVAHYPTNSPSYHVGKFGYAGDSPGTFLSGRHLKRVTTDDTTLFFLYSKAGNDNQMRSVLKVNPSTGQPSDSFDLSNVNNATGLAYCPYDNLLYVSSDSLLSSHYWNVVQRYTKSGTLSRQDSVGVSYGYWNSSVVVNDVRLFWSVQNPPVNLNTIKRRERTTMADAGSINVAQYDPGEILGRQSFEAWPWMSTISMP